MTRASLENGPVVCAGIVDPLRGLADEVAGKEEVGAAFRYEVANAARSIFLTDEFVTRTRDRKCHVSPSYILPMDDDIRRGK